MVESCISRNALPFTLYLLVHNEAEQQYVDLSHLNGIKNSRRSEPKIVEKLYAANNIKTSTEEVRRRE